LAVPANTLIVADTFGFHARGASQGRSTRVEVRAMGMRAPFLGVWSELVVSALAGRKRRKIWNVHAAVAEPAPSHSHSHPRASS
jgi:hypothetical protein